MKQSIFKKTISLLLVMTMLMPFASTALASDSAEEMGLMAIGGDGDSQLFGGGFTGWGLKTLLSGTASGLVGIGLNQAYKAIFGSDTDRIMAAIDQLSKKIDTIDANINLIIQKMEIGEIQTFLNKYRDDIAPYKALFKDMQTAKKMCGGSDEESKAKKKQFLLNIYYAKDPNLTRNGLNITGVVRELKAMLVDRLQVINGRTCNVFGAFDLLELKTNLWEHQGYNIRSQFQNTALGLFTDFAVLAELAVAEAKEDCKAKNDAAAYNTAEIAELNLKNQINEVNAMAERCRVIQHPDLRIIRTVDGNHNLYAFYKDVNAAYVKYVDNPTSISPVDWSGDYNYINCMITELGKIMSIGNVSTGSGGSFAHEVLSSQATIGQLMDIRWLYGNTGGRKGDYRKNLYDILFDPEGANFNNVGNLKRGTRFTSNCYTFYSYRSFSDSTFFNPTNYERWETHVLPDPAGKLPVEEGLRLARINTTKKKMDHWIGEKFFSVVRYTDYVTQGELQSPETPKPDGLISGMEASYTLPYSEPIELSVEEVDGAKYQWFVHKGNTDKGFEEIEGATVANYTINSLDASMNGWSYLCTITEEEVSEWGEGFTVADPVTLVLTGEGIPEPVTVHEVGTPEELEAALGKVEDGSWEGHTIKLTAEIKYQKPITLNSRSVTIDLNGYNLGVMPYKTAQPNINPMSDNEEIAAINVRFGKLSVTGDGELNVFAPEGVDYSVYAGERGEITVHNAISNNGGTAVYATDGGIVEVKANVGADGNEAHAVRCFDGGSVTVNGNAAATGELACGVYADASNGLDTAVTVNGNIIVSGKNSKGASVYGEKMGLEVEGSVTANGSGATGIFASGGDNDANDDTYMACIHGDVTASYVAVNASDGADVNVSGNVTSSEEAASAIYAVGGSVKVNGNVTSTGINGTAISASKWDLTDTDVGAFVKADGKLTAYTPLRIESLPVDEDEHTGEVRESGHYIYTDGTSTVWAKEDSFVSTNPNAQTPIITVHPKDETAVLGNGVTLSVQARVTDGGTLSYQWYSNTANSPEGAQPIADATSASYVLPTDKVGTMYYYVAVTNTNNEAEGEKTTQVISSLAAVNVVLPQYLALGDSIAAGYGLVPPANSYASIVQKEINLPPSYNTANGMTSGDLLAALNAMTSEQKAFLSDVKVVTLSIGSNDVLSPFLGIIANQLQCTPDKIQETLAGMAVNNPEGLAAVLAALDTETTGLKNNPLLLAGASSFANNFKDIITKLKRIMPNAKIYVTNIYNPYLGISLPYGTGALDLGTIAEGYVTALNGAFASHGSGYTLINVNSAFKNATTPVVNANKATFNFDPHPNKDGHELIADLILADYENVPSYTYTVKFMNGNKVHATKTVFTPATVIDALPSNPTNGSYTFSGWYTGKNGTGKVFTASTPVTSDITVYAYWTKTKTSKSDGGSTSKVRYNNVQVNSFADVKESDWFCNAVSFCSERGITNGTSATTFSPQASLTRGQFITMLLKAYDIEPFAYPTDNFADAGDTYYTGYLAAAKAKGLSNGVGDNKFDPERSITRQEMFTLLFNTLKVLNKLPASDNGKTIADFTDSGDIASWAIEAMTLLVESGIVSGNGGKLYPASAVTRAEMAQVLYNLLSK